MTILERFLTRNFLVFSAILEQKSWQKTREFEGKNQLFQGFFRVFRGMRFRCKGCEKVKERSRLFSGFLVSFYEGRFFIYFFKKELAFFSI